MEFVYERCGHCGRKGVYVVPGRDLVRCKYCSRRTATIGIPGSDLADAATRLKALLTPGEAPPRPVPRAVPRAAASGAGDGAAPVAVGGVWRMDPVALEMLAGAAAGRLAGPRQAGRAAPAPAPPAVPSRSSPEAAPRAFVVDDDDQVRAVVAATLRRAGFAVSEAANGLDALEAIVADPPDVAVLDLSMPGMDGLALLVELRRRCDTGIVVLSGRAEEGDRVVGLELGADDYLGKPFSRDELVARVRAVARRRAVPAR